MKKKIFALFLCLAMIAGVFGANIYADGRDLSDFEIELDTNEELPLEALAGRVLPESDRPEVVSSASVAANGHVNRLRGQETELSDVVFQNSDGTKTLYRFSYPVKYVDENGNTQDKSNSVSAITEGNARYGKYAYVNLDNDINTYFPQTLNSAQGISLEWDDFKIEMSPISAAVGEEVAAQATDGTAETNAVASAQAATAQKLSYTADGNNKEAVGFNGVFGTATSVRYTPTFDGVKEDIILNSYNGTSRFTFHITTNGLALLQNGDGQYVFADPTSGETKALLGELVVYDSSENVDAYTQSSAYNHRYVVSTLVQNNKYAVTVVVDETFLESDDTVYPVYIDPQLTVWYDMGSEYIQDTNVYAGAVESDTVTNTETIGTFGLLYIGNTGDYAARALIDFEWLGYEDNRNPLAGAHINSAKLYIRDLFSAYEINNISAYGVDPSVTTNSQGTEIKTHWRECVALSRLYADNYNTSVHYDDRTVYYGNAVTQIGGLIRGVGFYDFDITEYVESMLSTGEGPSGTKGIMLKAEYEDREAHIFASKEYSIAEYRPALVVSYSTMAFADTSISTSVDQSVTLGATALFSGNHDLSSSDTSIATVSWVGTKVSQGIRITGKSEGVATIKMYYRSDPSLYVRCTVTVSSQNLLKIFISPAFHYKSYLVENDEVLSTSDEKKNMDNVAGYLQDYLSYYYVDTMVDTTIVGGSQRDEYLKRGQTANDEFFMQTPSDKRLYLSLHTNAAEGNATYTVAFYNSVGGEKTRGLAEALTNAVYPIIPLGTYHVPISGKYGFNINTNPLVGYSEIEGNLGELRTNEGTYNYYNSSGELCYGTGYNTPVVLLEIAFHTTPIQTRFLVERFNEKYIAATIAKSLVEYYNLQPRL